jgi:hypothetical protein
MDKAGYVQFFAQLRELHARSATAPEMCTTLGVGRSAIYHGLKKLGLTPHTQDAAMTQPTEKRQKFLAEVRKMHNEGKAPRQMAEALGTGRKYVYAALKVLGLVPHLPVEEPVKESTKPGLRTKFSISLIEPIAISLSEWHGSSTDRPSIERFVAEIVEAAVVAFRLKKFAAASAKSSQAEPAPEVESEKRCQKIGGVEAQRILFLANSGVTPVAIAERFGISRAAVHGILRANERNAVHVKSSYHVGGRGPTPQLARAGGA